MPGEGRSLGSPAYVSDLRTRRLLRRLKEQACHGSFPCYRSPDHTLDRARRGLDVVLHRPDGPMSKAVLRNLPFFTGLSEADLERLYNLTEPATRMWSFPAARRA